jgi:hypothetical protein
MKQPYTCDRCGEIVWCDEDEDGRCPDCGRSLDNDEASKSQPDNSESGST